MYCAGKLWCPRRSAAPGTIRRELTVLRAEVNYDYEQGRLTAREPVWLPEPPDHKDRLRAARAMRRARLHLPLFVLPGLYAGARKQAILSLRWPQEDLDRGLIDFNPPGRERISKGRRIIPVPCRPLTVLRPARRRGSATGYVLHYQGSPIGNVKKAFTEAGRAAGLKDVTPHT